MGGGAGEVFQVECGYGSYRGWYQLNIDIRGFLLIQNTAVYPLRLI
jgi:hypothetical protein